MPEITLNDIKINYWEEGEGFPFIFIHGISDDSMLWSSLIPEFSKYYRTIALDIRGHGYSSKPDMPYSIKLFSEDLLQFYKKLDISQAHLLGLSMGGAIVQQFALDHARKVSSLILLSTFHHVTVGLQQNFQKLRSSLINGGFSVFFDDAVKLVLAPEFISANIDAITEMKSRSVKINCTKAIVHALDACLNFDIKNRISQISLPTLIISGEDDIFIPPQLSEEIHHLIKSSKWKVISDVGHNLLIPEKIQELTQIIMDFL